MHLDFNEELLLSLYLEFFREKYDVDNRNINEKNKLINHVRMQNICYLFKCLDVNLNYNFIWDDCGPVSPGLEVLLRKMDNKPKEISKFYKNYIDVRNKWHNNYEHFLKTVLSEYLSDDKIDKIADACVIFEDIIDEEKSSEYIAGLLYISKNCLSQEDFSRIINEMEARGYESNLVLETSIWKNLKVLNLVPMNKTKIKVKC